MLYLLKSADVIFSFKNPMLLIYSGNDMVWHWKLRWLNYMYSYTCGHF